MHRGAAIGHFGKVFGREDGHHAGGGADGGQVYRRDLAMRDGGEAEGKVQGIGG